MFDKIKCEVGMVSIWNGQIRYCVRTDESHSYWLDSYKGNEERERLMLPAIYFRDLASGENYLPLSAERINQFLLDVAEFQKSSQTIGETKTTNEDQNTMAKKTTPKIPKSTKTKTEGKPGKIKRADEMLLSGKFTKLQVAAAIQKEFGMPEKTARNTTWWAASTISTRHAGKVSQHLLPKAKAGVKPAKATKSAEKKSIPSRKPKTEAAAPVEAPVTTPETPAA